MDDCLDRNPTGRGAGRDNMTAIIIALPNGKSEDEWRNVIAGRAAKENATAASDTAGISPKLLCT